MALANQFTQPMDFYGAYGSNTWAGYTFKESLGVNAGVHTGVDYNGPGAGNSDLGMETRSIAAGIVRWTGNRNNLGYGNMIIIEHPLSPTLKNELGCDSLYSRYMHLNQIDVTVDQEVAMGQKIGTVGNSGTTWAHLHLDLYKSTIDGGGVHFRYDKFTQLLSYLDGYHFIQNHLNAVDLAPSLLPYQRVLENKDGVYQRETPSLSGKIIKDWAYDAEPFNFKGYVRATDPYGNGNNIWFVGSYSSGYFWSGAFIDKSTQGLVDLTDQLLSPTPPIINEPVTPVYTFDKAFDFVNDVFPAAHGNFEVGNFPSAPSGIVIHDFGTENIDTYSSLKNEFTKAGTEKSAFLAFSKDIVGQNTKLGDRAYHAGPQGNVYYGFEIDPAYKNDPTQIANIRKAVDALQKLHNKKLQLYKHSEFMNTACGDDVSLNLYDVQFGDAPIVTPPINPPSIPDQGEVNNDEKEAISWLTKLYILLKSFVVSIIEKNKKEKI